MDTTILANYLNTLEKCGIPGCACVICRDHKPIFRHIAGYADAKKTAPLDTDSIFWLYSASKPITCTAVLRLMESGALRLDDPVSTYLPEYGDLKVRQGLRIEKAKTALTIRHLLSMQSGLNYDLSAPSVLNVIKAAHGKATTREIVGALALEPLDFEPGTRYQYSLSHDVLGAVIEAASKQTFGGYLSKTIFEPLGMKHTGFRLGPDDKAHLSGQFEFDAATMTSAPVSSENAYVFTGNYESGGAGLFSTVDDYALFLDAMSNNGVSAGGYRLLTADSIEQMRTNQLHETAQKDFDLMGKRGYGYGLGVRTLIEKERSGAKSPLGEFGWDGAAGAYALMDTENRLAIFYAQHVLNCGYAYEVIHPRIRDIAYETLLP
jgi:Beta-lactamase class C and other penicillin binding proteins